MNQETKRIYEAKAEMVQAVAHPIRLAIIDYLSKGEQCVCDIVDHVSAQRSNVSRHLSVMVKAGLLNSRKDGLKVMYSLRTPCILSFLSCVDEMLRERISCQAAMLKHLEKRTR
ncbi:MAG: ArsR/SmtB family transcription factor [Anaerohalosphaeraceae bacterium]|jgi:DNA-binding transcriptional ArsR family regulator